MKFWTSSTAVLLAGLLASAPVASAHAQEKNPLRIGLLLSLSGPAAAFGIPERDAVQVLVEDINKNGGVNGRKIDLAVYDDTTNPTEAARGATKLIRQDKVVAIIGASTGSGSLAASPIAAREKVPILMPNATISVTARENAQFPYAFRSMSNDLVTTKKQFDSAIAQGAKKVAIFHQEDAYGKDSYDYVQKLAEAAKVEVVGVASAPLKSIEIAAQATKLRNANPDVVLMHVTAPALGAAFVRASQQVGLSAPIWGGMGLGQKAFVDGTGAAGNGVRLVVVGNWDDPSPRQAKLGEMLRAAGKSPVGFAELLTSNGLIAIVEAAKLVEGEITGPKLRDRLETLCKVTTYSEGELCYSNEDHDGWSSNALTVVEIRDGAFKRLEGY
ncbi:Transporter [Hyphomicrobiales bacterium]|nr:ABC transporter substrate-binding protein [Bosea sp. (in: a-proteobacteria)]CAH1696452.1 ABC transporter substrate-binding protein [Hyphomicrobiales bacterium]CAH1696465.1 Transporter [Hyphomicrobiales bacterium]